MSRERLVTWRVVLIAAGVVLVMVTVVLFYLQRELDTHVEVKEGITPDFEPLERVRVGGVASFRAGCERGCGEAAAEPSAVERLKPFELHRAEVTEAAWAACVEAGACAERDPACNVMRGMPDHPVTCVSWAQARSYCVWSGGRLPRASEWEWAARGEARSRYVWGEAGELSGNFARDIVPGHDDGFPGTSPAGWPGGDRSAWGALGLAGNVSEWVDDCPGCEGREQRAAYGGSFASGELEQVTTSSRRVLDGSPREEVGFRCRYELSGG